jgi:hypothetical protein
MKKEIKKNVIDIFTKELVEESLFIPEDASAIIAHLLRFKSPDFENVTIGERFIIDQAIRYISNAAWVSLDRLVAHGMRRIEPEMGDAS